MGLQAIAPTKPRLIRFDDSLLFSLNQKANAQTNPYAGLMGVSGLGADTINWATYRPTPDDEATTSDANGNTIYTDWTTRRRYTFDDNGAIEWLGEVSTGGASSGGFDFNSIFGSIFGTAQPKPYQLPDGSTVTYNPATAKPAAAPAQWITGVPNSYLVIGAVAVGVIVLMGRR
jgi:hypothetical protein